MYNPEKLKKINKIIKDMVFDYYGPIASGFESGFQYQFQIVGVRQMISVGEMYDFLEVEVTIIKGYTNFSIYHKIFPEVLKEYILLHHLDKEISEELEYFFKSTPKVILLKVKLSDEYKHEIEQMEVNKKI
jgi:hypothetical protein